MRILLSLTRAILRSFSTMTDKLWYGKVSCIRCWMSHRMFTTDDREQGRDGIGDGKRVG